MNDFIYTLVTLLFVVGLIFITAALFKKFQPSFNKNNLGKKKRLVLEEVLILDYQTKLFLLKRDDISHLIAINKEHIVIIESCIK